MSDKQRPERRELPIRALLPNLVTIIAICAGLTAIRFGVQGDYERAVLLILLAGILDGIDGYLARALKSDSAIGAELDSLADFVNFGVAPPLVMYFWALQDIRSAGWVAVLFYSVCCVVRLARFNVVSKSDMVVERTGYFVGVPSPAGALLVMLPMFLSFSLHDKPIFPAGIISVYMILVGLSLISRIPTWSFKALKIPGENVKFVLVGVAFVGAAVMTFAWVSLVVICIAYICIVGWTILSGRAPKN